MPSTSQQHASDEGDAPVPMASNELPDPSAELYSVPPQQYDEHGHPINPASRAYGRAMRAAQNDILAAVGVVVRNAPTEVLDSRGRPLDESAIAKIDEENEI